MQLRLKFAYWNVNGLDYQSAWAVEKAIKTEVSAYFFILLCLSITFTNPRILPKKKKSSFVTIVGDTNYGYC